MAENVNEWDNGSPFAKNENDIQCAVFTGRSTYSLLLFDGSQPWAGCVVFARNLYLQEICIYRRSYLAEKGTIYNFLWSILALYLHGCFSLYFTQDSGTADFSRYTIQSLNHFCFEEIRKYEIFNVKNDFEEESVVETIGKLVCPNDCSSNGVCNGGVWFI